MARWSTGAAMLLVFCVSACGGSGPGASGPASPGSADTPAGSSGHPSGKGNGTAETSPPNGGGGSGGGGGGADDEGFAYAPWGPDDPPIPTQYAALAASAGSEPRCDDLAGAQPGGAFWETALGVCRAITGDGDWPETTTVPAPPPALNAYQACLDEELTGMLERALRWHADHPGQRPIVTYPSGSSRSPCQARIYEVRVLDEADVDPDEGHPAGVGLAITGSAMDQDPSVTVDGQPAEFTRDFNIDQPEGDGLTTLVVLAPADEKPRTATIEVSTYRGRLVASVDLPASSPSPDTVDPTPSADSDDAASPSATVSSSPDPQSPASEAETTP
jgi:hypothetical protein